jgi:hypothetical protein
LGKVGCVFFYSAAEDFEILFTTPALIEVLNVLGDLADYAADIILLFDRGDGGGDLRDRLVGVGHWFGLGTRFPPDIGLLEVVMNPGCLSRKKVHSYESLSCLGSLGLLNVAGYRGSSRGV